jgi:MoaA/NifB/PqqE/SkfB family radical SAM enzyme
MNNSKTICPLPWIHIATRPNGDVRLCATANASGSGKQEDKEAGLVTNNGTQLNLRQHTIEEVWNSDYMRNVRKIMLEGNRPDSCLKCYREEDIGINSKRLWETAEWKDRLDIESIVNQTTDNGSLPVQIPYFDLRLGNLCQLKCIMCSPHDSSGWIKDWKIQNPNYKHPELRYDQQWAIDYDYTWYKKGSFINSIKSQVQNIKELYFAGGEPLLIPEHYKILEFMVDTNNAKNCILRYNSNGLEVSTKLLNLWHYFKEVRFNLSIDAVGDKNDYIRYPSRWEDLIAIAKRLDNTEDHIIINIACAVQLLNVMYLDELIEWKLDQKFKKINLAPFGGGLIGMHLVTYPSYLNIKVLPPHLKQLAKEKIEKFLSHYNEDEFNNSIYGRQRWEGMLKYMMSEDYSDKLDITVEYLEACDKTRGTNFREIFKELNSL